MIRFFLLQIIVFFLFGLSAQNVPIGTWTAHLPMANAVDITQSNDYIYCATEYGIYSVNIDNQLIEKYTKTDGLSEVEPAKIAYNKENLVLIITYKNSNIDLIKNGKIVNIPYLKNANIVADKKVYSIVTKDNYAYLATGFGVVVIDLINYVVKETFNFTDGINTYRCNDIFIDNNDIYAATQNGVYKNQLNQAQILNFSTWQRISDINTNGNITAITKFENKIWASISSNIYNYDGSSWQLAFSENDWTTLDLSVDNNHLQIVQHKIISGNFVDKRVGKWQTNTFIFYDTQNNIGYPLSILEDKNQQTWFADLYSGLVKQTPNPYRILPNGPGSITNKDMAFAGNTLFVASSNAGNSANPTYNKNGIYILKDEFWTNYNQYNMQLFDTVYDITIAQAINSENKVIFGGNAPGGGIIEWNADNNQATVPLHTRPFSNTKLRITGSTIDAQNNVWITDAFSTFPVIYRKSDGTYAYFQNAYLNGALLKDVAIDDYGQVWIAKESNNGGLVVLNHNNTLDDASDDTYVNYATGENNGNLSSNNVICLITDKEGEIWLGTSNGISVIRCAGSAIDLNCPAEQICISRNDNTNFCDNLLENQVINCIQIDAANRKWIGTQNGIYLVSADGETQIHYFNTDNSPILGNVVRSIAIHPNNGDVYIGTDKGINVYRSEATVTNSSSEDAFVYPNPVYSDYVGTIAIKNIPNNCEVKITDVAGNLVYQTQAIGGQATWDGNLHNGQRAASGVYLVLCKGKEKKEKVATKFVLFN
jgi:ligand-binding sensor domain-containing protein